jgi:cell wall-associated NlpC family hydrolase
MTPRHVRRLGVLVVIASLFVQLGALGTSAAAPLEDKQAEVDRVQRQLDDQARRAEALDERYNQARLKLDKAEAAVSAATQKAQQAEQALGATRSRVRDFTVRAYMHGRSTLAVSQLTGSDGSDLPVRNAYVKATTSAGRDAIGALSVAKADLSAQRAQLEQARQDARAGADRLGKDRQAAQHASDQIQATLAGLRSDVAQLLAQRQAEQQAIAARNAQAELAARQAADAQRQATLARQAATPPGRGGSRAGSPPASPAAAPLPPPGKGADAAIAEARRQLGKPYKWGGAGPDRFDCSGLTMWAWRAGGVSLSHSTYAQWDETTHIPISQMQPGDLIFFGSDLHHMAMYTGGGMMIEAPHSGANVREVAVRYGDLYGVGRVAS